MNTMRSNEKNKKLLVVNYYFPPVGGAGVKRMLKFIKFLPLYHWEPIVLTVKYGNHPLTDYSLLKEINSDVAVYRAFTFEYFFNRGISSSSVEAQLSNEKSNSRKYSLKRMLNMIYKYLGEFLKIPDSRILWLPAATIMGIKLLFTRKFDAIYATAPTFSSLIIGAVLKVVCRRPLIVDFRDAWIGDPMLKYRRPYLMKISSRLEKFVINNADRIISTNPFVTKDFQERYCNIQHWKFDTIYNGYDMDDYSFIKLHNSSESDKFTIVHTGILYNERTPKYFLEAIREFLKEKPELRSEIEVLFIGPCEKFIDGKFIEDYLKGFGLEDIVKLTGQIPRKECFKYQAQAHLLLMIIGIVPKEKQFTYGIPGKVFDYILSKKPILTLANDGASREFLMTNNIGDIYYHDDRNGIKDYLIDAYNKYKTDRIERNDDISNYKQFDFRKLTQKLSLHLNDVLQ